ncbi:hypothetical protein ACIA8R_08885 [Nonomuraea sp. NPDC051191]|uniref:hypothetical protein n=1 Tax=Nonomuraea sp. NPDC051191 TaxID=3364372 RepID=UPI003791CC58
MTAAQSAAQEALHRARVAESEVVAMEEAKNAAQAPAREADARAGELLALLRQRDTPA